MPAMGLFHIPSRLPEQQMQYQCSFRASWREEVFLTSLTTINKGDRREGAKNGIAQEEKSDGRVWNGKKSFQEHQKRARTAQAIKTVLNTTEAAMQSTACSLL